MDVLIYQQQILLFMVYNMFWTKEKIQELKSICGKWIGIKYRHMGNNTGGIDCTKLMGVVFVDLGILSSYEDGVYYSKDWFYHSKKELVLESFVKHSTLLKFGLSFVKKKVDTNFIYKTGDIVLFSVGDTKKINHTGIYFCEGNKEKLFHADVRKGVSFIHFLRYFKARARYVYRII